MSLLELEPNGRRLAREKRYFLAGLLVLTCMPSALLTLHLFPLCSSPGGSGRSCGTTQAWDSVGHAPITPSAGPAPSSSTAGTQGSAESTGGLQAGQAGQAAREDENPRQAKKPRLGQRLYRASQLTLEILEERVRRGVAECPSGVVGAYSW